MLCFDLPPMLKMIAKTIGVSFGEAGVKGAI